MILLFAKREFFRAVGFLESLVMLGVFHFKSKCSLLFVSRPISASWTCPSSRSYGHSVRQWHCGGGSWSEARACAPLRRRHPRHTTSGHSARENHSVVEKTHSTVEKTIKLQRKLQYYSITHSAEEKTYQCCVEDYSAVAVLKVMIEDTIGIIAAAKLSIQHNIYYVIFTFYNATYYSILLSSYYIPSCWSRTLKLEPKDGAAKLLG